MRQPTDLAKTHVAIDDEDPTLWMLDQDWPTEELPVDVLALDEEDDYEDPWLEADTEVDWSRRRSRDAEPRELDEDWNLRKRGGNHHRRRGQPATRRHGW